MSTNFPTSLDSLTNPTSGDSLNSPSHADQHTNANDAIEALEAKVGINSSAVTTSHDYKLGEVTGSDKAVGKTATQTLTNKTLTAPQINMGSDATGDMYYRNGSGVTTRLAIGSSDQILAVQSGIPAWIANPSASDASYSTKGIVKFLTDAATSGITVASGVANVNMGTGANQVVQLDASSKLPAIDGSALTNLPKNIYRASSSSNLKLSADTNRNHNDDGTVKVKEIIVNYGGVISTYFEGQGNGFGGNGRVYVNGVATGTLQSLPNGSYGTFTEDITINAGDRVQLYSIATGGAVTDLRNFRIRFDLTLTTDGYVVTD